MSAIGVALLAALISWAVFMRWVFGDTPHWAEELPQFVLIWMAMLSAVWCSRRNSHLTAGLLGLWLHSAAARRVVDKLVDLILVIAMLMLVKAGWDLAMLTMKQHTPALQWPVGLLYLSVPVSCSAIALVHLGKLLSFRSTTTDE
ncbi:TRAP transporter small permease [Marinobacterium rhizophilum]|uniref:TRAP transporter small permease protein n=1 Tax=Marinobacterium rhizophilum TaxID=420402 RepID=A0ABY5HTM4_9GAMM|nr:TRAP transporter small permease [Marinobacterium rhizophilum]